MPTLFKCPRCGKMSIPIKDKYKAGFWAVISCKNCEARLCIFPWLLAVLFVAYVWDVVWFYGMYHFTGHYIHFLYMIVVWLMLDAVNIYFMPLASMKTLPPAKH
jgi:hypothetical protein